MIREPDRNHFLFGFFQFLVSEKMTRKTYKILFSFVVGQFKVKVVKSAEETYWKEKTFGQKLAGSQHTDSVIIISHERLEAGDLEKIVMDEIVPPTYKQQGYTVKRLVDGEAQSWREITDFKEEWPGDVIDLRKSQVNKNKEK